MPDSEVTNKEEWEKRYLCSRFVPTLGRFHSDLVFKIVAMIDYSGNALNVYKNYFNVRSKYF